MRFAVIDSSPLINLVHLELASKLSLYFERVYIPRSVQTEVNRKSRFRYRMKKLYKIDAFRKCNAADEVNVRLLLSEIHQGEAEALVQAQEQGAAFFIGDEKRARKIAENMGLEAIGILRILARLHLEGYAEDPYSLVHKLRKDLNYRVTDELVQRAVETAHLPIK